MRSVDGNRCSTRWTQHATAQQFCIEDVGQRSDFCGSDLGGPFITTSRGVDSIVGILSDSPCLINIQTPSQPSLITRISFFREWIFQTTQI